MENKKKNKYNLSNEKRDSISYITNIKFEKDIIKDSYSFYCLYNSFIVFESIDNILYIIYTNTYNSIIAFDFLKNQKLLEIKNHHQKPITSYRHYLDNNNKRDLIISISTDDNNILLWNVKNFECLYNYKNINKNGYLYSACFLNDNNNIYIITTNCTWKGPPDPIKLFDFNGNKIKEMKNSKDKTFIIDAIYDRKLSKHFLITGNEGCIKSFNYNDLNNLFRIYSDNDKKEHDWFVVNNYNEEIQIIESNEDGFIRIWNFYSAKLIKKIKICDCDLFGLCLWNKDYLIFGCEEKLIKILDIKNGSVIKYFKGHNSWGVTIKKIFHHEYGECLISQGAGKGEIKLWISRV